MPHFQSGNRWKAGMGGSALWHPLLFASMQSILTAAANSQGFCRAYGGGRTRGEPYDEARDGVAFAGLNNRHLGELGE